MIDADEQALARVQQLGAYIAVRKLEDGSIAALGELMFTRAIYLSCNEDGWSRRFCFDNRETATREFHKLKTEDDVPTGWIARRPEPREGAR